MGLGILPHVGATLLTILGGYLIALIISLPLAVALFGSRVMSHAIYPLLIIKQSVPVVALAPILIVVLGAGEAPRIAITVIIALFPMVVSTATGLKSTPVELADDQRERVAAQAPDRGFRGHAGGDAPGQFDQGAVADGVAEAVVDVLEAVQVEQEHAESAAAAVSSEESAVAESGEESAAAGVASVVQAEPAAETAPEPAAITAALVAPVLVAEQSAPVASAACGITG